MKKLIIAAAAILATTAAHAQSYTNGYYRSNGTYVQGYYRSAPDAYRSNNYSSYGNYNPYTGARGTRRWY